MSALGTALKARYADGFGLIGPQYLREELSVRSTDVDRTLSSSYLVIGSLYPGGTLPVPVHTGDCFCMRLAASLRVSETFIRNLAAVSRSDDNLLLAWSANCPQYAAEQRLAAAGPLWANVTAQHSPLLQYLGSLGIPLTLSNVRYCWCRYCCCCSCCCGRWCCCCCYCVCVYPWRVCIGVCACYQISRINDPIVCEAAEGLVIPPQFTPAIQAEMRAVSRTLRCWLLLD